MQISGGNELQMSQSQSSLMNYVKQQKPAVNLAQTGQVSDLSEIRKEVDPDNSLSNEELNEIQKQANLESGLDQNG